MVQQPTFKYRTGNDPILNMAEALSAKGILNGADDEPNPYESFQRVKPATPEAS